MYYRAALVVSFHREESPERTEYSSVWHSQQFRPAEATATVRRLCPLFAAMGHLALSRISLFLAMGDERDAEIVAHQNDTFGRALGEAPKWRRQISR
jgi:hypothetical protein